MGGEGKEGRRGRRGRGGRGGNRKGEEIERAGDKGGEIGGGR